MRTCRLIPALLTLCASIVVAQSPSTEAIGASVTPPPAASVCNVPAVPNVNQLALLCW